MEDIKVKTREDTVALSNWLDVFADRQQSTVITYVKWNILLAQRLIPPLPYQKGWGSSSRQKRRESIYLNAIITRYSLTNYSLFRNETTFTFLFLFIPVHVSSILVLKRKKKITSTRGRERNLVFGCWPPFSTFIATRASYFPCFLFIYELPSAVLHFPSSLSIFLSTFKYHFLPPPTSFCSRKTSRRISIPSLCLSLLEMKLFRLHGREGEGNLPFRTSIPSDYATSASIILLSRKNSTNEPNLSDQKRNAQILSLVSRLPSTFFFLSSSLFPSGLFHCSPFLLFRGLLSPSSVLSSSPVYSSLPSFYKPANAKQERLFLKVG